MKTAWKKNRNRLHRGVQRLPEQRPNGEKTDEHEMWAYSKWSFVRVQLHNWKNGYSKITGLIIYIYTCYICIYPHKLYMYSGNVATERVAKTNLFCLAVERGPCQLHEFLRLFSCAFRTFHTQQNLEALSFWSHSPSKLNLFYICSSFFSFCRFSVQFISLTSVFTYTILIHIIHIRHRLCGIKNKPRHWHKCCNHL